MSSSFVQSDDNEIDFTLNKHRNQYDITVNDEFSDFDNENDGYYDEDDDDYSELKEKFYSKYEANRVKQWNSSRRKDNESITQHTELNRYDLEKIHEELNLIHHKLVNEFKVLQDREIELKKRECECLENEIRLTQFNKLDAKLRLEEFKLKYEDEIEKLKNEIKEKNKDNRRLNESFKLLKQANDSLKTQNVELQEKNLKLEKQYSNLNSRFNNLQKMYENDVKKQLDELNVKQENCMSTVQITKEIRKIKLKSSTIQNNNAQLPQIFEIMATLIDWVNESSLKAINLNMPLSGNNKTIEKFCKILPLICDLLNMQLTYKNKNKFLKFHLPFLEFVYWSLLHFDTNFLNQKVTFSSIYRHIGEQLYKPLINIKENEIKGINYETESPLNSGNSSDNDDNINENDDVDECEDAIKKKLYLFKFIKSDDIHIRILSCLIIIRTLNQVDYLVNVFDILRNDLKNEDMKELFLNYYGVWALIKWCKLVNKPLLTCALDTYLQLCIDSPLLERFLIQCSNETWFSNISILMRQLIQVNQSNNIDFTTIEKLSVLLQRLSKIKANRKYFEIFSFNLLIQELIQKLRMLNANETNNFLFMNLKSIQFNITPQPTPSSSSSSSTVIKSTTN